MKLLKCGQIFLKNKDSKLILKSGSSRDLETLSKKFYKYKIAKSIEFKTKIKSFDEHLNLYQQVDLSLDTFPYNELQLVLNLVNGCSSTNHARF